MIERFAAKVERGASDACWPWQAAKNSRGYGVFRLDGVLHLAHRLAVTFSGRSIPSGFVVDHVCRNRLCCNPAHLRVVTPRENALENSDSVAAANAVKTHCDHGHAFTACNTGISGGRRYCRQCARERARVYYWSARGVSPG